MSAPLASAMAAANRPSPPKTVAKTGPDEVEAVAARAARISDPVAAANCGIVARSESSSTRPA
jgi:hypothetical protein